MLACYAQAAGISRSMSPHKWRHFLFTWLGDLGGGVASLARRRATNPKTSVQIIFKTSDYGVMDNLEGDVGGYLVACGSKPGGEAVYPYGKGGLQTRFMTICRSHPIGNGRHVQLALPPRLVPVCPPRALPILLP